MRQECPRLPLNVQPRDADNDFENKRSGVARKRRRPTSNPHWQMHHMLTQDQHAAPQGMALRAAADLQDHLLVASNDLERLQRLLDDAGQALMGHFIGATEMIDDARRELEAASAGADSRAMHDAKRALSGAIVGLQFQDMATQLIAHTTQRLRSCADRLANEAMADDEDGVGLFEKAPERPNPVTQDEMDAGTVDLF